MASVSFDDIKHIRLSVVDPVGYNDFISVPTETDLPTTDIPPQTAFYIEDIKVYKAYSAELAQWDIISTELSNDRIAQFIQLYGIEKARYRCLRAILISVGRKLGLERLKSGADELVFLKLNDLYAFYKSLLEDIDEEINGPATGMYLRMNDPTIAGGI